MGAFQHSLWLILHSQYALLLFSFLLFDVPRYLISVVAVAVLRMPKDAETGIPPPSVSVVMAVFNGAPDLLASLKSVHRQSLPPLEVILVNDGSQDETGTIAALAKKQGLINQYIHHPTRCGKSPSINEAVRFARGKLVLCIDHDAVLADDAIEKLAGAFQDPQVALASGNLTIRNRSDSIWTSLQSLEYLVSITSGRTFLDVFHAVSCCSGAFSMFRRKLFSKMGGCNTGPGEDLELTLRFRRLGHRVRFVHDAKASVEAPASFDSLLRQRLRWDRDALNIRLNQYNQLDLVHGREKFSETLQILDFVVFDLIPTTIFPLYLLYIFTSLGPLAFPFLITVYGFLLGIYAPAVLLSAMRHPEQVGAYELALLPVFPLYQGVIMKMVRFAAFSREVLFRESRRDDYVPPRVRRAIYGKDGQP